MSPCSTCSHIPFHLFAIFLWLYVPHSEKLRLCRPSFTSLVSSQETGATCEYQGQTVSFEWQSRQERSRTASASGVSCALARSVFDASTGGFVIAGLMACATTNRTTRATAAHFKNFFMCLSAVRS